MRENDTEYKAKQVHEFLIEYEAQSEKAWTKDEWMKAMDDDTLLVPPTTPERVEWFEEWVSNHPERVKEMENDLMQYKARMFDEKNLQTIFFRIWLKDNGAKTGFFHMFHKPDANTVQIKSIDTGKEYTLKL